MPLSIAPSTLVKNALALRLLDDAGLTGALATYRDAPAIFTGRLAPADAEKPFVHIRPVAQSADDALVEAGLIFVIDVAVFALDRGSSDGIEAMAARIRELFHNRPLDLVGSAGRVASVAASQVLTAAEEPDGIEGRIVSLTIRFRE